MEKLSKSFFNQLYAEREKEDLPCFDAFERRTGLDPAKALSLGPQRNDPRDHN